MSCDCADGFRLSDYSRWIMLSCIALLLGCSSGVDPISIHDPSVPTADRRLIADGQDRVAVARAQYDEASAELVRMEQWHRQINRHSTWPDGTSALVTTLHQLLDARTDLLELQAERAAIEIDVAEAELELLVARVAVRNDRAVYDLEDIRDAVDDEKEEARQLDREIMQQMERLDQVTQQWWNDYSSFARGGGDVTPFYVVFDRPRR